MSGRDDSKVAFWIAMGLIGSTAIAGVIALGINIGEDFLIPLIMVLGIGGTIVLKGPMGEAIAERIRNGPVSPEGLPVEVQGELDDLRNRVFELEERVDFAERLLARDEPVRIDAGRSGERT